MSEARIAYAAELEASRLEAKLLLERLRSEKRSVLPAEGL